MEESKENKGIYKDSAGTPPPLPQSGPASAPPPLPGGEVRKTSAVKAPEKKAPVATASANESFEDKRIRLAQEKVDKLKREGVPGYRWNKQAIFLLVCSLVVTVAGAAAAPGKMMVISAGEMAVAAGAVGIVVNAVLLFLSTKIKKMNELKNYVQAMQLSRKVGTGVGYSFIVGCAATAFITAILMFKS